MADAAPLDEEALAALSGRRPLCRNGWKCWRPGCPFDHGSSWQRAYAVRLLARSWAQEAWGKRGDGAAGVQGVTEEAGYMSNPFERPSGTPGKEARNTQGAQLVAAIVEAASTASGL